MNVSGARRMARGAAVGLLLAMAAAGFADTHAAAASAAQLASAGKVAVREAALGLLAAFSTNSLGKIVIAFVAGGVGFGLRLAPGVIAINAVFAAVLLLFGG